MSHKAFIFLSSGVKLAFWKSTLYHRPSESINSSILTCFLYWLYLYKILRLLETNLCNNFSCVSVIWTCLEFNILARFFLWDQNELKFLWQSQCLWKKLQPFRSHFNHRDLSTKKRGTFKSVGSCILCPAHWCPYCNFQFSTFKRHTVFPAYYKNMMAVSENNLWI